jgi:hypothetical protein
MEPIIREARPADPDSAGEIAVGLPDETHADGTLVGFELRFS